MKDKGTLTNDQIIYSVLTIFVLSFVFMILVQIPTPDRLNPFGCLFGSVYIVSGVFSIMALFLWE